MAGECAEFFAGDWASHSRAVWSSLPVSTCLPSGEKHTQRTPCGCPNCATSRGRIGWRNWALGLDLGRHSFGQTKKCSRRDDPKEETDQDAFLLL